MGRDGRSRCDRSISLSRGFSTGILVVGIIVIIGWRFDIELFKRIHPSLVSMKANTAACFILAGVSLLLQLARAPSQRQLRCAQILAALVALIGLFTALEHALALDFKIDSVLFRTSLPTPDPPESPRMAPATALMFLLLGTALGLLSIKSRTVYKAIASLTLTSAAIVLLAFITYFYGVETFPGLTPHATIALHTILSFFLLCAAILTARPQEGIIALMTRDTMGGLLARRLFPPAILLPVLLGSFALLGSRFGLFHLETAIAFVALVLLLTFAALVWNAARTTDRLDLERQDAEQLSAYLAAAVESSTDAIVTKDLNGIITSWNFGAERLFGYSAAEAVGQPILIIIPSERRGEEEQFLSRLRAGKPVDRIQTVRRHKDGALIDVSITVSPVKDQDGNVVGASKVARDIRDVVKARQTLEERRAELEKLVAERTAELEGFSYSVAHDMRAPLRAMQGFSRILQEKFCQHCPPEAVDYLNRIITAAQRLDALIQDVLNYNKVGRGELPLQPVNLDKFLPELISTYPNLSSPDVGITIEPPLGTVTANPAALTQVISNLLGNAVKFVEPGTKPHVCIRSECLPACEGVQEPQRGAPAGWIRLWIEDNGIGIPEHAHKRLFQMFHRVNRPGLYEGTGMGLAIVKKALQRTGGDVGLESEVGKGSRFWILLPAR